jgi:ArsR family transcriptional regulator
MSKSLPVLSPGAPSCAPLTTNAIDAQRAADLARVFKALGDPARLRLLSLIVASPGQEACVCDLGAAFDLSQPTISHHLKVLHDAGLLERDKRGVWVHYRASSAALAGLAEFLAPA